MPPTTLLLHVGYPKTATTSLQSFCADNRPALAARGLLYPNTGRIGKAHYAFNFSIKLGQYDRMNEVPDAASLMRDLRQEIAESGLDRVLLSSEYFIVARNLEPVAELFAGFDTKIVFYLRRHDYAFESAYNQSMKSTTNPPWGHSLESFIVYQLGLGTVPYDYVSVLRRWADTFGQDNILVRPYEREQNRPDIFQDFATLLGAGDVADWPRPAAESNASLSTDVAVALDLVQRAPVDAQVKLNVVNALMQLDATVQTRGTTRLLSPTLRGAVIARYAGSYAAIARQYLDRADGILFTEPVPRRDEPWTAPAAPSMQTVTDLVLRAVERAAKPK